MCNGPGSAACRCGGGSLPSAAAQGSSSNGRANDSKSLGWGFESLLPCHPLEWASFPGDEGEDSRGGAAPLTGVAAGRDVCEWRALLLPPRGPTGYL